MNTGVQTHIKQSTFENIFIFNWLLLTLTDRDQLIDNAFDQYHSVSLPADEGDVTSPKIPGTE